MDPVTLSIIAALFVLATGGATTAAVRRRRKKRQRAFLREHLRMRRPIAGQRLAIFDVFWDLGASDFALELMSHHYLLPDEASEQAIAGAWSRLEELVTQHGDYDQFLVDSLEAIQEFFVEHRHAGHRRRLPNLTDAARRVIPVPRRLEGDQLPARTDTVESVIPDEADAKKRREYRRGFVDEPLQRDRPHEDVDLDKVGDIKPLDLLHSVLEGSLAERVEQWWKMRRLRRLRTELDEALADLYHFYADLARRERHFYEPLYDAYRRWKDETTRLRFAASRRSWADQPDARAADVLFELAVELSKQLARRAYDSTYHVVETIHGHARRGDLSMAGYLVYLNRHPLFAGRYPQYADPVRRVEFATHRVREELVKLRDQGVL